MSKQNVVKKVQSAVGEGVSQEQIGSVFDATFEVLSNLEEEQRCRIKDFGTFKVKKRAARPGTSLKTKKKITIPARLAMTFKLSTTFKDSLNAPAKKKAAPKKKAAKKSAKKAKKK